METPPITVSDFKSYFTREFIYGITPDTVLDGDIERAINESTLVFNSNLWIVPEEQIIAYQYLTAHFLVLNIRTAGGLSDPVSGKGITSTGSGTISSKSVGSVSVGYSLPSFITNSSALSGFLKTEFGIKYLQLLAPRLVGNVSIVDSGSNFDLSTR